MSYFARVAQRAAAPAVTAGSALAIPTVPSQSPLAQIDQRLNLDPALSLTATGRAFAGTDDSLATEQHAVPAALPAVSQRRIHRAANAALDTQPLPASSRFQSAPAGFASQEGSSGVDGKNSLSPSKRALETSVLERHRHSSRTEFRLEPPAATSRDDADPEQPANLPPAPGVERLEPTRGTTPAPSGTTSATLEPSTRSEGSNDSKHAERPLTTPRAALFDALTKVEAWMKTPAAPAAPAVAPSIEPATPRHAEHAASGPPLAIAAPRPPTQLSIGRIDVRVLSAPPARAAVTTARRAAPRPARSSFAGPRPFGWRQR